MKHTKRARTGIFIVLALLTTIFISASALSRKKEVPVSGNGFAVLELFTSEGCSSCPPAERLLEQINSEAAGKSIYVLAYHVDYWDHLGWKDAFSDATFSERQYNYNRLLAGDVYTPQLIVNGTAAYIGSDRVAVNNALEKALDNAPVNTLALQGELKNGHLQLAYKAGSTSRNLQLVVAIVQRHVVSHVHAGENEGRTLSHVQIVRNLYTHDLKQTTSDWQINLPEGFNSADWEVIGWIQNQSSGAIEAATRATIHSSDVSR